MTSQLPCFARLCIRALSSIAPSVLMSALALTLLLAAPRPASAACAAPAGVEGEMIYNDDHNLVQFCDGSGWIGLGVAGAGTPGGGAGQVQFNDGALFAGDAALVWDNANKRLGIGTTTPGAALDVKGTLRLSGSTSGFVGLAPAAAAGSTTYTLPSADGTSGQVLATNGAGSLAWTSAGGIPTGAVMAFDLAGCPAGWSEYTPARGRFIRGIDSAGTNDPDGVRARGSLQADGAIAHNHSVDPPSTNSATYSHTHSGATATGGAHSHSGSAADSGLHVHSGATANTAGAHTHTVTDQYVAAVNSNVANGSNRDSNATITRTTSSSGDHSHTITIPQAGAHSHTVTVAQADAHSHSISSDSHSHSLDIAAFNSASNGTLTETRPKNVALLYCRKD